MPTDPEIRPRVEVNPPEVPGYNPDAIGRANMATDIAERLRNLAEELQREADDISGPRPQPPVPPTTLEPDVTPPVVSIITPAPGESIDYGASFYIITGSASDAVDVDAPEIDITSPTLNAVMRGSVLIEGTAQEVGTSGLSYVEIQVDGLRLARATGLQEFRFLWDSTAFPDGHHVITAIATDRQGNSSQVEVIFTTDNATVTPTPPGVVGVEIGFRFNTFARFVDTDSPTVTITKPISDGVTVAGTYTFEGMASDAVAVQQVEAAVDSGEFSTQGVSIPGTVPGNPVVLQPEVSWSYSLDSLPLTNGEHSVRVRAVDSANNKSTIRTRTFVVANASASLCPPGSIAVGPSQDLGALIAARGTGVTYCLAEGTYRWTKPVLPKDGVVIQGAGLGKTIIKGSKVVTNFASSGSDYAASIPTGINKTLSTVTPDKGPALAFVNQEVFLNQVRLTPVATQAELVAGKVFIDWNIRKIWIRDNPTGAIVEMSYVPKAFSVGAGGGWKIKGVSMRQFANSVPKEGVVHGEGVANSRISVEDCDISYNHGRGFTPGDNNKILRSTVTHNGFQGVGGEAGSNLEMAYCEIAYDVEGGWVAGWAGGNIKLVAESVWIHHCHVHHSPSNGIWGDRGARLWRVEDNSVHDTGRQGIMWEISYEALIRRNVVNNTGTARDNNMGYAACIMSSSSGASTSTYVLPAWWATVGGGRSVLISGNTVGPLGGNFISVIQQARLIDGIIPYGEHVARGVIVEDNDVFMTGIGKTGFYNETTLLNVEGTIWRANRYRTPGAAGNFWAINGTPTSFAAWKASGRDTDGSHSSL